MPSRRQSLLPAGLAAALACALVAHGAEPSPEVVRGRELASRIGCAQCHTDLEPYASFREATPDLGSAGLRYQPAWLFEFLQDPVRVRHHLGPARMPKFPLSPKEALALTAFLETQRHVDASWPAMPAAVTVLDSVPRQAVGREQFHAELARGLICLTCHDYAGQGGHRAVELTNASLRLRPEWVRRHLVAMSHLALAHLRAGDGDKAILHFQLGQTLARLGRVLEAIQSFEAGLRLAPDAPAARHLLEQLRQP